MSYVLRNGVAVYCETLGKGPAILLTHGFGATGRMWSRQTFISVGSNDQSYLGATEYLEAKIPRARRTVFDGAGHAANYELSDQFNAALDQFLVANSDAFAAKA